eukprot:439865_1
MGNETSSETIDLNNKANTTNETKVDKDGVNTHMNSQDEQLIINAQRKRKQMIDKLVKMGFDRELVITALEVAHDDIKQAVDYLTDPFNVNEDEKIKISPIEQIMVALKLYEDDKLEDININTVLNCFIYVMLQYEGFGWTIHDELNGQCDITNCMKYQRNNRPRRNEQEQKNVYPDVQQRVFYEIMDKIHCFWYHLIDSGASLSKKGVDQIVKMKNDMEETKSDQYTLINPSLLQLSQKLTENRKKRIQNVDRKKRFQQLIDDVKTPKTYNFGIDFCYGYDKEYWNRCNWFAHKVTEKYKSLKEELTSNPFA